MSRERADEAVSAARLAEADRFIEQEEGAVNRLHGALRHGLTAALVATSLLHLYAAFAIVSAPALRVVHVGLMLALLFLTLPAASRFRDRVMPWDWLLALAALGVAGYLLADWDAVSDRATEPSTMDLIAGGTLIVLVLEAVRRASGWVMPFVVLLFIAYAFAGPWLPPPWTHKGYDVDRLIGHMTQTLEGIFGSPVDVCATLIILFTIYGAMLSRSGAGKFFIDFALAAWGGVPVRRAAQWCSAPSCWAAPRAAGSRPP